jgi:hypothetical protein
MDASALPIETMFLLLSPFPFNNQMAGGDFITLYSAPHIPAAIF